MCEHESMHIVVGATKCIRNPAAVQDTELLLWLQVYDLDGDGLLSQDDLRSMLSYLVGGELTEEQCQEFLAKCAEEAGTVTGISFAAFCKHADVSSLEVQVPTGF